MTRDEAKQHIDQIRQERFWLGDPSRKPNENPLMAMLRRALNQLATGIFEHAHHYVFELTQNADDNSYRANAEQFLKFVLLETDPTCTPGSQGCLCVLNDETGFEKKHVDSLCDIGNSTKRDKRDGYIGEKGIGFKSVFLISDRPHIVSNGYSFHFRRDDCEAGLGYIVPHWVPQIPAVADGSQTAILLPLRSSSDVDVAKQLADIEPECILFLRRLRRLELVSVHSGLNRIVRRDGTEFAILEADGQRTRYFVHSQEHSTAEIAEPLRKEVTSTWVTVALPLTVTEATDGRVFAFLPTEARTGFPFLINADFLLPASRERILDTPDWNKYLVKCAAATFVEAFDKLRSNPEFQKDAYRFIPIHGDLLPDAGLFAPLVEAVHENLSKRECILTKAGDYVVPAKAFFAGALAGRLLRDIPAERETVALIHPELECYRERLKPLGIQPVTFAQLFAACNDDAWLSSRDAEWWETLFDLLSPRDDAAKIIGSFPIIRCQDGKCRPLSCRVFLEFEGQSTPTTIRSEWPAAYFFDSDLQRRLQQKPIVWEWLTRVAGLRPFSLLSYITDSLLDWMREQSASNLVEATHFIAASLQHLDESSQLTPVQRRVRETQVQQKLREKMPWLLADGHVLLPEARAGKELVTPECLEGEAGWNLLFPALDRHFLVISDAYCAGLSHESLAGMKGLFKTSGATAFPDTPLRELGPNEPHYGEALARCAHAVYGTPKLRDWAAPGWLLGLENLESTANGQRKVEALERWLKALGPEYTPKFLCGQKLGDQGNWQPTNAWSEFGATLHMKPWLRTTNGYVSPRTAFLDTPEFREFFGNSVAYVLADVPPQFLEKLGVRVHLTADVLIGLLRQLSGSESPDLALLAKIYRRLQDSTFDAGVFRREKLIFLSELKPRWILADKLVWEDAGALFDDDFGYVALTYSTCELRRFFTEKLNIPDQPDLKHYAVAWKNLGSTTAPDRAILEKKLRVILQRLATSQDELPNFDWWREVKPHLRIWNDRGRFAAPTQVYVPDDSIAVELFRGSIDVAFPPRPDRVVRGFLRWMGCRSLVENILTSLAGTGGDSARTHAILLTEAAKELCVLFVCSHKEWRDRCSCLRALLETEEVGVTTINVQYSLRDNPNIGLRSLSRDAYWDATKRRLFARECVDLESLRDAAAKSIAAEFFGEGASADVQAEFFRLLTVSPERARKLMEERGNWQLTPEQQKWLREQNWKIVITELDEVEQPSAPRVIAGQTPPSTNTTAPVNASTEPSSTNHGTTTAHGVDSVTTQTVSTAPSASKQEPSRSGTSATNQEQESQTQFANEGPAEFHDANATTAEFVEVKAHTRSSPHRSRGEQASGSQRESASGLTTVSQESKTDLERKGREFAAQKLKSLGYEVEQMGQRNPGFDIRAAKPGEVLKVEVKSHAQRASSVFVTQREWVEYLRTRNVQGESWELWNVENLSKTSGPRPTIQRIRHIPKSALKESGYWIDLSQCSQESPQAGPPTLT